MTARRKKPAADKAAPPTPLAPMTMDTPMTLPASMQAELGMPMDRAIDLACARLGLPQLGGPSGSGWSRYSTAQVCPYLFRETYEHGADGKERTRPAEALQVGGLYHALSALYYGYGLDGEGQGFLHKRGLLAPHLVDRLPPEAQANGEYVRIPNDASDRLLDALKWLANNQPYDPNEVSATEVPEYVQGPSESFVLQAERLFDAHTNYYGSGLEDLTPLAVEWFAEHPKLGYTCRYDAIMQLGPRDPYVVTGGLEPGGVVIYERKSAKYLSEWAYDSWFLDGEILGQILLWEPSGCAKIFGPLAGLVVDVVTKSKVAQFARIFVGHNPITVGAHARGIQYQNAEIALWRATGLYPKRWVNCWRYGSRCGLYEKCRADTATDESDRAAGDWNE